jgi:cyclic pyranopterin phosphate synthase
VSQHFCETCNRVRLSVDGILHLCLGQNDTVDLRTPLRTGCSDDQLEALLRDAIQRKSLRHEFQE